MNKKINIRIIVIIVLISIIFLLISVIFNVKNVNINKQVSNKGQLTQATSDSSYVGLQTHLEEVSQQEEKILNFKSVIANAITNEGITTSSSDTAETMENNIANILKERTKNATATADNISEGKTAWVNGELITGNGADIKTAYNNGYAEGLKQSSNGNAEIQYTYHNHVSSCYCGGYGVLSGYKHTTYDDGTNWIALSCNKCGNRFDYATKNSDGSWVSSNWWTLYNMSQSTAAAKYKCSVIICGKTTDTIESAKVIFK